MSDGYDQVVVNYVSGIDLSCLKEDQSIASGTLILDFHTSKVVHQDLLMSSLMSLVLLASLPSKVPELWKSMPMASLLVLSYSIVKLSVLLIVNVLIDKITNLKSEMRK